MRDADRGIGGVLHRGLRVEGDAQAGRRDHVEVIRAVADRHGLAQRSARLRREVAQREFLPGPVDDRAGHPPGQPAARDFQRVRSRVVNPEVSGEPVGELGETAAHDPAPVAEPLQRPDQRARSWCQPQLGPDRLDGRHVEPGKQRDPLPQRCREVQFPAHRRLGQRSDALPAAGPGGQQVDGLAPDQRRIDVHHDQPHRAPVQAAALNGHVRPLVKRRARQGAAQRVRVGPGHLELDACHRPVREPADPVDVGAAGRDPAGDGRDGSRGQRGAEHRDVQAASRPGPLTGARGDLGIQPKVRGDRPDLAMNCRQVGRVVTGQQHAEDQAAAYHYLFYIDDAQLVRGQHREQP